MDPKTMSEHLLDTSHGPRPQHEAVPSSVGRRAALVGVGGLVSAAAVLATASTATAAPPDTWVDNLAALKTYPVTTPMPPILVLGRGTAGDGGGGVFFWNTSAGTADDGVIVASSVSTAGKWQRVSDDQEWLNPRWYGCVCDGTTDDTAAFQKVVTAAAASRRGIQLPAGRIRLTAPVTLPSGGSARSLSLRGAGIEASQLVLTGGGCLDLDLGAVGEYEAGRLLVRDLGIEVGAGATAAAALRARFARVSGTTPKTSLIENVEVAGVADGAGPSIGVHMTDAQALRIAGLRVAGKKTAAYGSSVGLLLDGTSIPVEMFISDSTFYFLDVGIKVAGHLEGINIDHCAVVAANYGVIADAPADGPGLWLTFTNSTTNTRKAGVLLRNWLNFNISNNLFYGDPGEPNYDGLNIYTAVSPTLGSFSQITGNVFSYVGINSFTKNGVVIGGGPVEDSILISNNLFGFFTRGVYLVSDANRVAVAPTNMFRSCSSAVTNAGTSNVVPTQLAVW